MGSTGRLLGMSQDRLLVTASLAGTLEVTLQKWLALVAGNFSGEGKWVWALGSSEALPGMGIAVRWLAARQLILVKVLYGVLLARTDLLAS